MPAGEDCIIIRAAGGQKHTGVFGTGYRLEYAGPYSAISPQTDGTVFDGIVIEKTDTAAGYQCVYQLDAATKYLNCLIRSANPNDTCMLLRANTGEKVVLANCVVIGGNYTVHAYTGNVFIYNSIAVGPGTALVSSYEGASSRVKNSYFHGATAAYSGGITKVSCMHSSSSSVSGSTANVAYSTANFTNVTSGSEDLSLPSGSALIDAGTDLSADADYPFSTDILGATRSGTWEVGPFNYAAAASLAPPPYRTQARRIAPLLGF